MVVFVVYCSRYIIYWEMLTTVLRVLVKNQVKESFDITFMINKKKIVKILKFFFFIKVLFNWILNQCLKITRGCSKNTFRHR